MTRFTLHYPNILFNVSFLGGGFKRMPFIGGRPVKPQIVDSVGKSLQICRQLFWAFRQNCRFQPNFAIILLIVDFRVDCRLQNKSEIVVESTSRLTPSGPLPIIYKQEAYQAQTSYNLNGKSGWLLVPFRCNSISINTCGCQSHTAKFRV